MKLFLLYRRFELSDSKLNLACHKPSAFLETHVSMELKKSDCEYDIFLTHVFRIDQELASDLSKEVVGQKLYDVGCPVELNFGDCTIDFGPNESHIPSFNSL